jgi:ParB/RepB/Spo0J family partition protein
MSELAAMTRLIPLASVKVDKKFKDSRIHEDPIHTDWHATEGQHVSDLCESMSTEGMKLPIVVMEAEEKGEEIFLLRAGGRRRRAALRLGWTEIPAIVLPLDMPVEDQHWYNILENSGRKNLGTYELAASIKHMRDEFHVKPADFARKTGYSPGYVGNLLGCIDRLPEYLLEQWRDGARVALDQWISLSYLDHDDAIRAFQRMVGMTPKDRLKMAMRGRRRSLPSPRWMVRMQKLYLGIEGSELPPRTRDLVLRAVEVCMNQRDDIPGVYEPGKQRKYEQRARLRRELALPELPEPGEHREMPPPTDEVLT